MVALVLDKYVCPYHETNEKHLGKQKSKYMVQQKVTNWKELCFPLPQMNWPQNTK